jgi:CRP-like cAMP-binding protein/phosphoribosyl 1,2-cyclic phosphodiesterase
VQSIAKLETQRQPLTIANASSASSASSSGKDGKDGNDDSENTAGISSSSVPEEGSASESKPLPLVTKTVTAGTSIIHDAYMDQFGEASFDGCKVFLPRGGILVKTGSADDINIQFGMPPETIKDSMKLGFKIPSYFVITKEMFDRVTGTSLAEFEFPAYFNFFVMKKPVTIICQRQWTDAIKDIFTETLLGPAKHQQYLDDDYPEGTDEGSKPNWKGEGEYLDAARKTMKIDDLLRVVEFNPAGIAKIPDSRVTIKYDNVDAVYHVYTNDDNKKVLVASIDDDYKALPVKSTAPVKQKLEYRPLTIPQFGVTVLGASHGFDPAGTTTGFVIWVNGRGMMVDPPPGSTEVLEKLSIPSRMIEGVILTHCHADHDAGTFQRILKEQNVKLYTTRTIFESFIRKYAACTGFDYRFLSRCVTHYPCQVGVPIPFHGAYFKVFYSMHTIPCIGFEVIYGSLSMIYSADTNADPELPLKMMADGIIGKGRQEALSNNALRGNHSLIFHEAGVPPIHTPMALLAAQEASVKERMYLVHVSSKMVPLDSNLKVADEWMTIDLADEEGSADVTAGIQMKQCLISTEFFMNVDDDKFDIIIKASTKKQLPAEHVLYQQGQKIDKIYYVIAGNVEGRREDAAYGDSTREGDGAEGEGGGGEEEDEGEEGEEGDDEVGGKKRRKQKQEQKPFKYAAGDIFGQQSIVPVGEIASYTIKTKTNTYVYEIDAATVKSVLQGKVQELKVMEKLANLMQTKTWDALANNSILQKLTMTQCVAFASFLDDEIVYEAGEEIDCEQCGFLVVEGTVHVLLDTTQGNDSESDAGESDDDEDDGEEEEEEEEGTKKPKSKGGRKASTTVPGELHLEEEMKKTVKLLASNIDPAGGGVPGELNGVGRESVRQSATTFRGQHERVCFIDENGFRGTMVLDANAFIMNAISEVQVEAVNRVVLRKFQRTETLGFMHHNPGLMISLIDSIMSNSESTFY